MRPKKSVLQTQIKDRVSQLTDIKREALIAGVEAMGSGYEKLSDELYKLHDELVAIIEQAPKYLKLRTKYRDVSDYNRFLGKAFRTYYMSAAVLMDMPVYMEEWKAVKAIKKQEVM